MIKRGDGTTGKIIESAEGDEKGICIDCGRLFPSSELDDGRCGCSIKSIEASAEESAPETEEEACEDKSCSECSKTV